MNVRKLHPWKASPAEAAAIQRGLQKYISTDDAVEKVSLVAGADASFSPTHRKVHGAVCILSFPDLQVVENRSATLPLAFPYIPGLLTFREGPVLITCFEKLHHCPDVVMFDGQGIMHPRSMGIATHLGILLNAASLGCAKSRLYGTHAAPADKKGACEYVYDSSYNVIGACLRTRDHVKPVFVSPGTGIDLAAAVDIVLNCCTAYRTPEPLRSAHLLAQSKKEFA